MSLNITIQEPEDAVGVRYFATLAVVAWLSSSHGEYRAPGLAPRVAPLFNNTYYGCRSLGFLRDLATPKRRSNKPEVNRAQALVAPYF